MSPPASAPAREGQEEPAAEPRWKRRLRRLALVAIALELGGIAAAIVALWSGESHYLTSYALYAPRHPLLLAAVAGGILAPFTRHRHARAIVAVQIVVSLVVLFPVMGFTISGGARTGVHPVKLATYNVYFGKLGRKELLDELAAMDVDILVMQAPYDSFGARLKERFPDRTTHQFEDFVLVTRLPVEQITTPKPIDEDTSSMFVGYRIKTPGGPIGIYNVHPFSPRHALFRDVSYVKNVTNRETQIANAVGAAVADGPPFLIVGDTNLPGLSSIKRRHLNDLKDAWTDVGFGFGYTFPSKRPWMRIDRALASEGVRFLDARVGPKGASDHRPLFVDFEVQGGH